MTKSHRPGDSNNRNCCLTALKAGSPRSRCRRGHAPLEGTGGGSNPDLSGTFWWFLGLWQQNSSLCMAFSCACASVSEFLLFHKDTSHIVQAAPLLPYVLVLPCYNCNDPITKWNHILRRWGLELWQEFVGDRIQPRTPTHDFKMLLGCCVCLFCVLPCWVVFRHISNYSLFSHYPAGWHAFWLLWKLLGTFLNKPFCGHELLFLLDTHLLRFRG